MSSFEHINDNNKDILILGKRRKQKLDDTAVAAEAKYPTNFTQPRKRFVSSLHYNGSNSFWFVNTTKIHQFKAKHSAINDYTLCLGNISKEFTIDKIKKTGLNRTLKVFLSIIILYILMIF